MSTEVNTQLLERASEMIDYFEGKLPAQVIEADIERNDMDALFMHVTQAEAEAAQNEIHGWEIA